MRRLAVAFVLDGLPSRNAEASKILLNVSTAPTRWIAAVSAAEEISRKVREVRKEMKDGNGESEANVVTLCSKCEIPHCVSRKPPLDVARPRATT